MFLAGQSYTPAACLAIGEEFDAQWAQLYAELTGIGALTMTDTWQRFSKARGDATPLNSVP